MRFRTFLGIMRRLGTTLAYSEEKYKKYSTVFVEGGYLFLFSKACLLDPENSNRLFLRISYLLLGAFESFFDTLVKNKTSFSSMKFSVLMSKFLYIKEVIIKVFYYGEFLNAHTIGRKSLFRLADRALFIFLHANILVIRRQIFDSLVSDSKLEKLELLKSLYKLRILDRERSDKFLHEINDYLVEGVEMKIKKDFENLQDFSESSLLTKCLASREYKELETTCVKTLELIISLSIFFHSESLTETYINFYVEYIKKLMRLIRESDFEAGTLNKKIIGIRVISITLVRRLEIYRKSMKIFLDLKLKDISVITEILLSEKVKECFEKEILSPISLIRKRFPQILEMGYIHPEKVSYVKKKIFYHLKKMERKLSLYLETKEKFELVNIKESDAKFSRLSHSLNLRLENSIKKGIRNPNDLNKINLQIQKELHLFKIRCAIPAIIKEIFINFFFSDFERNMKIFKEINLIEVYGKYLRVYNLLFEEKTFFSLVVMCLINHINEVFTSEESICPINRKKRNSKKSQIDSNRFGNIIKLINLFSNYLPKSKTKFKKILNFVKRIKLIEFSFLYKKDYENDKSSNYSIKNTKTNYSSKKYNSNKKDFNMNIINGNNRKKKIIKNILVPYFFKFWDLYFFGDFNDHDYGSVSKVLDQARDLFISSDLSDKRSMNSFHLLNIINFLNHRLRKKESIEINKSKLMKKKELVLFQLLYFTNLKVKFKRIFKYQFHCVLNIFQFILILGIFNRRSLSMKDDIFNNIFFFSAIKSLFKKKLVSIIGNEDNQFEYVLNSELERIPFNYKENGEKEINITYSFLKNYLLKYLNKKLKEDGMDYKLMYTYEDINFKENEERTLRLERSKYLRREANEEKTRYNVSVNEFDSLNESFKSDEQKIEEDFDKVLKLIRSKESNDRDYYMDELMQIPEDE